MAETAPWITYRPELKVLDCTIRDGGLINNHQFTDELVRAVYDTCVAAGIDYMEVGYKNSANQFPPEKYGCWMRCDEADLNRVVPSARDATGRRIVGAELAQRPAHIRRRREFQHRGIA